MTVKLTSLERLLILEESYRSHPYDDHTGATMALPHSDITIGIGRNLEANGISKDEAIYMLRNDIAECIEGLMESPVLWVQEVYTVSQGVRFDVWVAMAFQMGVAGVLKWDESLKLFGRGEYLEVAQHIRASKWGRIDSPFRAERMAKMMESGEYLSQYLKPLKEWET